ncbi:MAG: hypothetical protein H7257_06090 [Taibaiella sp.]|nr:hypothetical protein [Taibaiella sp.]
MKALRNILITAFFTTGLFFSVTYTACNKDRCNNVACLNGGVCDGGNCTCAAGFEGNRCQKPSRDKHIGNYNGSDSCSVVGQRQYYIRFKAVPNKAQMALFNILGNPADSALCSMVAADSFLFNGNNNSTSYRGWGTIRNDSLHMEYSVLQDTTNYDCEYNGLKY